MALRDRLAARRQPTGPGLAVKSDESTLSVVPFTRAVPGPVFARSSGEEDAANVLDGTQTRLGAAKAAIHNLLVKRYADELNINDREAVRTQIASLTEDYMRRSGGSVNRLDYEYLVEALVDEVLGLGALQPLLEDPEITEIMINSPRQVYVERAGRMTLSPVVFESTAQLRKVIDRIVTSIGRRVDESSPMCDARLRDGSRVNIVLPPLALDGPCMTIRKFSGEKYGPTDLVAMSSATAQMIRFLEAAVRSRLSIVVSGGTSSGKTTLLNILSSFIPSDERIVTVEDIAELQLRQEHLIRLESRPANVEGTGAVAIRDLVRNALRMRPDRIVVGECRGSETLDMLQAMNTGHEGSMSTIHANSAYDALSRLETMILMTGADLAPRAIQKHIASAIDVIVQTERVRGGARKIVSISEITGLANDEVHLQELFQFRQTGLSKDGNAEGFHTATGLRSIHLDRFAERGEPLSSMVFEPTARAGASSATG
jgi:pilus assembly protein CpaF